MGGGVERALRDAESALKVTQQGWDTSLRFLMPDPSSPASYAAFGLFPKTQGRFRILIPALSFTNCVTLTGYLTSPSLNLICKCE